MNLPSSPHNEPPEKPSLSGLTPLPWPIYEKTEPELHTGFASRVMFHTQVLKALSADPKGPPMK